MLVSVLLFSALVATGDAPSITTRVDVTRAGDVVWNADPCTIEARRGTAVVATVTGDAVELTPGPVVLVVSCDAKEGTVRRSLRVDIRKPQTLKVTLAPGFVVATIDQGGTKTAGTIVVYDDNDIEVARGADRKALAVDAGSVAAGPAGPAGPQPARQHPASRSGPDTRAGVEAGYGLGSTLEGRPGGDSQRHRKLRIRRAHDPPAHMKVKLPIFRSTRRHPASLIGLFVLPGEAGLDAGG